MWGVGAEKVSDCIILRIKKDCGKVVVLVLVWTKEIDIIAVVARGAGTDNTWVLHWIRARFTGSHHWQTK